MIKRKKAGQELDSGPRIEVISEFIERELRRLEGELKVGERVKPESEKLDEFFRSALDEIKGV